MFAASFLPVFLAFVVGQAAAWIHLRTGRYVVGFAATVPLWLLLDWWLVARYVYAATGPALIVPAAALQVLGLTLAATLSFAQWRRRWSAAASARDERFGAGMTQYLRADYAAARATFTGLVRTDPWDVAAWIALGDVFARSASPARARRCYRRARALDVRRVHADLLQRLRLPATR